MSPKLPILDGNAKSDYENYLRTDELLSLQKEAADSEHRDELLFTIVHQTSELWLKLATNELSDAVNHLRSRNCREPQRLLSRAVLCLCQTHNALDMLDKMSPWDYQQVRKALGHGSGFDSPGFNRLRKVVPQLGEEFQHLLDEKKVDLVMLFRNDRLYEDLYQLAEGLLELDNRISLWRLRHLKVVERNIGSKVQGTQGTPVDVLNRLNSFKFFPELWEIRSKLTELATD